MANAVTEAQLSVLVDLFYARVREDAMLGPIFNNAIADWPEHLEKLTAFWSSVMLTSGRYKGQPLAAHIRQASRIDNASFDRWLALWKQTTEELFDPALAARLQEKAARIAESLQLGIRFAGGEGLSMRPATVA